MLVIVLGSSQAWGDHLTWMPAEWKCCDHGDCFASQVTLKNESQRLVEIGNREVQLEETTRLGPSLEYQVGYVCFRDTHKPSWELLIAPENLRCVFYRAGGG